MTGPDPSITDTELRRLTRELRHFGWGSLTARGGAVARVSDWLRRTAGLDAVFVDGSFDVWILRDHWGVSEFERWRDFRAARRRDPTLTPEDFGLNRLAPDPLAPDPSDGDRDRADED
ncbi:hypothetical protein [Frigidibacter sp. MR17.24]|uniref:hypothetical protein n=1 Tax=Frigidibacter sp. MR17.24 TaxID=3127345 RepID=UPI003012BE8D